MKVILCLVYTPMAQLKNCLTALFVHGVQCYFANTSGM